MHAPTAMGYQRSNNIENLSILDKISEYHLEFNNSYDIKFDNFYEMVEQMKCKTKQGDKIDRKFDGINFSLVYT